jgi:hypothetical protein
MGVLGRVPVMAIANGGGKVAVKIEAWPNRVRAVSSALTETPAE